MWQDDLKYPDWFPGKIPKSHSDGSTLNSKTILSELFRQRVCVPISFEKISTATTAQQDQSLELDIGALILSKDAMLSSTSIISMAQGLSISFPGMNPRIRGKSDQLAQYFDFIIYDEWGNFHAGEFKSFKLQGTRTRRFR